MLYFKFQYLTYAQNRDQSLWLLTDAKVKAARKRSALMKIMLPDVPSKS